MINKLEKILVDKKTENIDVFLQIGSKINEIIDSVNSLESAKQTIAGLMERVSKLEIKTANLYEPGKGGLVPGTAFNLDMSNLDTKKEHALRLQLRDTKEQFKQLEEVHRKLVKAHKTLQKSYTEKEAQWNNLSDALIRQNEEFDVIAQDRSKLADDYREFQGNYSSVLQENMKLKSGDFVFKLMQENKRLLEENFKLKGYEK